MRGTTKGTVGFIEHKTVKCPECGKKFAHNPHSVYGGCCSYTCFRVKDRIQREEARKEFEESDRKYWEQIEKARLKQLEIYAKNSRRGKQKELKERVKFCFDKERGYINAMRNLKRGTREYKNAVQGRWNWRKKRIEAQEALEKFNAEM